MKFLEILLIVSILIAFKGNAQEDTLKHSRPTNESLKLEKSIISEETVVNSKIKVEPENQLTDSLSLNPDDFIQNNTDDLSGLKIDDNYYENDRWEGMADVQVSGKFDLVAFQACRPDNYSQSDVLKIAFYQFENIPLTIRANTIKKSGYGMEVVKKNWSKGWQLYSTWKVSDALIRLNVKPNNLGVLIKSNNGVIHPAYILKNNESRPAYNNYKAYFYTPQYIQKLEYKIYDSNQVQVGKTQTANNLDEASSFPLNIKLPATTALGKYTLQVTVTWENNNTQKTNYDFYHVH